MPTHTPYPNVRNVRGMRGVVDPNVTVFGMC
jgi:hypothetical protein